MNWRDYLLYCLGVGFLAIIPLALAAYGGHVAADAIPDIRQRRTVKRTFWFLFVIGVAMAAAYQYRITKSDSDRQTSTKKWQDDIQKRLDEIIRQPVSAEQKEAATDLKHVVTSPPTGSKQQAERAQYLDHISNVSDGKLRGMAEYEIAKPLEEKHGAWQRQDNVYQAELARSQSREARAEIERKRRKLTKDFFSDVKDLLFEGKIVKAELERRDLINRTLPSQEEKDLDQIIGRFEDPYLN
jgi:hypothetical protein